MNKPPYLRYSPGIKEILTKDAGNIAPVPGGPAFVNRHGRRAVASVLSAA